MERIAIVGTTGSGKTTLSRQMAERLGCHCCELDAIHWQPGWRELDSETMAERVGEVVEKDRWIVEGNYASVRRMILERADTLIWLDYPFPIVFARLLRRTVRRNVTRENLWSGNRESLKRTLSSESILVWCIKTYGLRRREYSECVVNPDFSHLRVLRFRHPREARAWLGGLGAPAPQGSVASCG
jgi:adenylate kinase family enzyme